MLSQDEQDKTLYLILLLLVGAVALDLAGRRQLEELSTNSSWECVLIQKDNSEKSTLELMSEGRFDTLIPYVEPVFTNRVNAWIRGAC